MEEDLMVREYPLGPLAGIAGRLYGREVGNAVLVYLRGNAAPEPSVGVRTVPVVGSDVGFEILIYRQEVVVSVESLVVKSPSDDIKVPETFLGGLHPPFYTQGTHVRLPVGRTGDGRIEALVGCSDSVCPCPDCIDGLVEDFLICLTELYLRLGIHKQDICIAHYYQVALDGGVPCAGLVQPGIVDTLFPEQAGIGCIFLIETAVLVGLGRTCRTGGRLIVRFEIPSAME